MLENLLYTCTERKLSYSCNYLTSPFNSKVTIRPDSQWLMENIKNHVFNSMWQELKVQMSLAQNFTNHELKDSLVNIKVSGLISSLVQKLHMTVFGWHFDSIPTVLNLSTNMPQKIIQYIFFYTSWRNQNTHRWTFLSFVTINYIFMISKLLTLTFSITDILFSFEWLIPTKMLQFSSTLNQKIAIKIPPLLVPLQYFI